MTLSRNGGRKLAQFLKKGKQKGYK
uniref:Uncharacterized protein n=1 Tax=Nelumbo nucifera TaxID=4432 RepID=A0A822Y748_NELNU|nr:TPA_asm: hypothetical protein HUJ06_028474 [Nelumbo nucifera]